MKANRGVLVFKSWSKEICTNTSHSQNDLENVPPKEVCYTFDSERVCVA